MPFTRMTSSVLLAFLASASTSALATPLQDFELEAFHVDASSAIVSYAMPSTGAVLAAPATASNPVASNPIAAATDAGPAPTSTSRLRRLLADFSMTLRDIRYRRGGSDPKTGFDCSGFVRYVYQHSLGAILPGNSASQFDAGANVARSDMKIGDLVFFRTHGKRVSHVGIYLGDNRFIHSPSTGKRVSVSSLDEAYWAHRFAGARRPKALG